MFLLQLHQARGLALDLGGDLGLLCLKGLNHAADNGLDLLLVALGHKHAVRLLARAMRTQ
jgi:hypothetical protein